MQLHRQCNVAGSDGMINVLAINIIKRTVYNYAYAVTGGPPALSLPWLRLGFGLGLGLWLWPLFAVARRLCSSTTH